MIGIDLHEPIEVRMNEAANGEAGWKHAVMPGTRCGGVGKGIDLYKHIALMFKGGDGMFCVHGLTKGFGDHGINDLN